MRIGLCVAALTFLATTPLLSQVGNHWPSWKVKVVDAEGTAISGAHVYVHNMGAGDTRPDGDAAVPYVADTGGDGGLSVPASVRPRDLLVFAPGFKPFVGYINAGPGATGNLEAKMDVTTCDYPAVICDTFGTAVPKKRKH